MSILSVHDIRGISSYGNTIRIPAGSSLSVEGGVSIDNDLKIPVWTTETRPLNPDQGYLGYNSSDDVLSVEIYTGTEWKTINNTGYPVPVQNGLILDLDANRPGGVVGGSTWVDHSGVIGNVNTKSRNSDWSFTTEYTTGLYCIFNQTNRTGNSSGINLPGDINSNGFNKMSGTIELWIRRGERTGGHGWFNNSDGTNYTNASNWLWFGTWSGSDCYYFRQGNPSTCCNDVSDCSFRSSGRYNENEWIQMVAVWDVATTSAAVWRNGVAINTRTNMPSDIPNSNPSSSGQIFNGHNRSDNMQFKGYCSMYRIYDRALTDDEIIANWTNFRGMHGI